MCVPAHARVCSCAPAGAWGTYGEYATWVDKCASYSHVHVQFIHGHCRLII